MKNRFYTKSIFLIFLFNFSYSKGPSSFFYTKKFIKINQFSKEQQKIILKHLNQIENQYLERSKRRGLSQCIEDGLIRQKLIPERQFLFRITEGLSENNVKKLYSKFHTIALSIKDLVKSSGYKQLKLNKIFHEKNIDTSYTTIYTINGRPIFIVK